MSRRSWAFDIAVALLALIAGQAEVWAGIGVTHRQGPAWVQALTYGLAALALVFRRRAPLEVLTFIVVVYGVSWALVGSPEGNGVGMMPGIAGYSVARWEKRRPAWYGLVLLAVFVACWIGFDPLMTTWTLRAESLFWGLQPMVAWLLGALVRSRLQVVEQRKLSRAEAAARAVSQERNRVARELHDVIGHHVSLMTLQATAVRRRLHDDQQVEIEALLIVEQAGREALGEMRRMVAVLRDEDHVAEFAPAPGLTDLPDLVARFEAAGLPVRLTVRGTPTQLGQTFDMTAYRIIQEGLTNVLRHAQAPSCAEVLIDYHDHDLELVVRDDGQGTTEGAAPGHGLIGMRERVAVYGGHLTAGAVAGGGFELRATLPLVTP
ncbi:sensor histidine kinase [Granulicoccus phenolivorans]|uniref:sensor histidine kinase n=1 Tax=Granulicoccus phenolivorans TaxID=266854 RepID=UPI0004043E5A|nr:histidine kinase [Granulicoccus phenolivorans]